MVLDDLSQRLGKFRCQHHSDRHLDSGCSKPRSAAIYPQAIVAPVLMEMRKRYLLKGKSASEGLVRLSTGNSPSGVQFGRLNLMDTTYPLDRDMDIIFCRNMLIYFNKLTQHEVLSRLCDHLRPGGFLFLGHSESLAGFGLPLTPCRTNGVSS